MFDSNCCFFTNVKVSQEAGKVVWYSYLLKNFPQFVVIHTVKGFSIVNKAEIDVSFLFFSFFFNYLALSMIPCMLDNLISDSSFFSKSTLNIWEFLVHILLKSSLEDFEVDLASMWNEWNWVVVWTFFGIAFLWDWNENWHFPVLWPLLSFLNLLAYWLQYFHSIIF